MKKRLLAVLLCVSMISAMVVGCGSSDNTAEETVTTEAGDDGTVTAEDVEEAVGEVVEGGTYAYVSKSSGNPYNEKQAEGFVAAIEEAGGTAIVKHPESATAEDQITMINELVAQGVDSIAIAGNDYDALEPALTAAMEAGIEVSSMDANVNPNSRATFVNQAGVTQIAETLMDAVLDITGGEGQWAILSATTTATNQNAWIDAMKVVMEDETYAGREVVEVAYGDDEYQKSVDHTQA